MMRMNNTLIPIGWAKCFLGDVLVVKNGYAFKSTDYSSEGIPLIRISDIQNGKVSTLNSALIPQNKANLDFLIETGDLLIAMSGATTGKIGVYEGLHLCLQNQRVGNFKIYSKDLLDKNFRNFYVDSLRKQIEITAYGGAQPNISSSLLEGFEILLPPLNEQRRIVAKLEKLLAKVDTCKERLDKISAILKRFRQSVLSAACSGRLTADWRENNPDVEPGKILLQKIQKAHELAGGHKQGNAASPTEGVHNLTSSSFPNGWEIAELRDICEPGRPITYGILKPGAEILNGVPYIRVADFPNNRLKLEDIRRTSAEIDKAYARSRLRTGDILLSIRGTVGRLCKIPPELNEANITQDSARLSIQSVVNSDYICWFLKAMPTQKRMQNAIKGVAIRGINIGDVRALQIALPPYEEQQEIVRRVENLFKTADQIEQRYQKARTYIDQLTQSILAKAFRGELVPQDPNDEPASVLLEQIRAERENRENVAKTAKKPAANKKQRSKKAQPQLEPTPQLEPIQLELPLFE